MDSLFALHGVIARKVMPRDQVKVVDKDDPTFMNFGMLIKLGKSTKLATGSLSESSSSSNSSSSSSSESDSGSKSAAAAKCKLPVLSLPCFFTNFCSSEQLTYSKLNERGFIKNGDHIPVHLHIRDTFQPLAASIASGFSTFLTLFYMDHYPRILGMAS